MTSSRAGKTLEAMRANPRDWKIADLEAVASAFGKNQAGASRAEVMYTSRIRRWPRASARACPSADQAGLRPRLCALGPQREAAMISDIPYPFASGR